MTTKEKLTIGIIGGLALYAASMFDGRVIYDPHELVDCKVGRYTFTIEKTDCKGTIEYALSHAQKRWPDLPLRLWRLRPSENQTGMRYNN